MRWKMYAIPSIASGFGWAIAFNTLPTTHFVLFMMRYFMILCLYSFLMGDNEMKISKDIFKARNNKNK